MRVVSWELKRGYTASSFVDAVDREKTAAQQQWEKFIEQADNSARNAHTFSWILIQRRDRRQALAFLPRKLWRALRNEALALPCPFVAMRVSVKVNDARKRVVHDLVVVTLVELLRQTTPEHIISIADCMEK